MNFTTDLPKRNPLVSYIVSSAVKCEKFFPGNKQVGPAFRMHAVILKSKSLLASPNQSVKQNPERIEDFPLTSSLYICCHVRKCDATEQDSNVEPSPVKKAVPQASKVRRERLDDHVENYESSEDVYFRAIRKGVRNENDKPLSSLIGNKRTRRQATLKGVEDSKDPYIYTQPLPKGSTRRTKRIAEIEAEREEARESERQFLHKKQEPVHRLARKPHPDLLPPVDFGARLYRNHNSIESSDYSHVTSGRRRAFTEMDDLLATKLQENEEELKE